jgi:transposase-like protein
MATRRTYTREFEREAAHLLTGQDRSVAEAAPRHGVSENFWEQTAGSGGTDAFPGHENLPPVEAEPHRPRAKNKRLGWSSRV